MKNGLKWLRWLLVSVIEWCSILPSQLLCCALVSIDNPICVSLLHLCLCFGNVLELEAHNPQCELKIM